MLERLWHMLVKECIQALRNPRMRALIFVTPVIQLFLFGYAVTTDVQTLRSPSMTWTRAWRVGS